MWIDPSSLSDHLISCLRGIRSPFLSSVVFMFDDPPSTSTALFLFNSPVISMRTGNMWPLRILDRLSLLHSPQHPPTPPSTFECFALNSAGYGHPVPPYVTLDGHPHGCHRWWKYGHGMVVADDLRQTVLVSFKLIVICFWVKMYFGGIEPRG